MPKRLNKPVLIRTRDENGNYVTLNMTTGSRKINQQTKQSTSINKPRRKQNVKRTLKQGEQIFTDWRTGKKTVFTPRRAEVKSDNRSEYQKQEDQKTADILHQKYSQQKTIEEGLKNLEAIGKVISPSTYVGPLVNKIAASVQGDKQDHRSIGEQILSGEGTGDTAGNLLLDFASPYVFSKLPNAAKQLYKAARYANNKVPYRFQIPTNEDTFYRILHGSEGISDANNSGMITRTFAPDYQFPYFTKGQLYSKQNPSFNFDNSVVITSKPGSGQTFHFVQDGVHTIDPKRVINVGDSATPVEISGIGNAYNSSPVENFEYWTRGNGWLTKHFWKRNQFTPFKNQRVVDTKGFGDSFAEGSESEVFNDPANKFAVVKEFSSGYKNNPSGMREELVRRNSVPGAMPTKMIGMSKYGYPILQQGRVTPIEEGTPWTYSLAKDAKQLFENSGYKYGLHQGIPNNGSWKIIDVSPQNLGYDSFGNIRTIDVMPDRLFNSGKDIHIKKSKRGTFTKAAKAHGMSVQGFANKVLNNPSNYSAAMRKKANFAHNAASWKH